MRGADATVLANDSVFQGRYRVIRCIKRGGMGAVYEVLDQKTKSRRALKVMLPSTIEDDDLRQRFALEAIVTGEIQSDHVVKVIDAGIEDGTGTPFIAMELLQGEELHHILKKRRPLAPMEAYLYLHQTAMALDRTHAAGIVHRDLKPENLFVTARDDGSPCLKVLDFGIAKVVQRTSSAETRALGTPLYMSPEQIHGEAQIGPASDLYALAHIAYTLLVGEPYWNEEHKAQEALLKMFTVIAAGPEERPSERALRRCNSRLPYGFDDWFAKATAARPEDRFPSARAQIDALAEVLGLGASRLSFGSSELNLFGRPQAVASATSLSVPPGAMRTLDTSVTWQRTRKKWVLAAIASVLVMLVVLVGMRSRDDGPRAAAPPPDPAPIEASAPVPIVEPAPVVVAPPPTATGDEPRATDASEAAPAPSGSSQSAKPPTGVKSKKPPPGKRPGHEGIL